MSVRALLDRPVESLLLSLGVALTVGATAAGITLAGTTRVQSEELLASPRYREIVVATRAQTSAMELPARVRTATDVVLTVDDLESGRSVTEAVEHAYLANPIGLLLGEIPLPSSFAIPSGSAVGGDAGPVGAAGTTDSVQVFVIPAPSVTSGQTDTAKSGSVSGVLGTTATGVAAGTTSALPDGSGEAMTNLAVPEEMASLAQPLLTAPDGPEPQLGFLPGLAVTPEFFAARGLTAIAGSLFTEADMARGEPILVLGSQLGEILFVDGVSVDRQVLSMNRLYRIIGVLAPSGTAVDKQAFTPALQAADRNRAFGFNVSPVDTSLRFTVADPAHLDEARAQLATHFATTFGEGAVAITIPRAEAESSVDRFRRLVTITLFLALSALLIAAVNMTNLFYSRAVRRQRSVGILKAVGASRAQVFAAFFLEALVIGAAGAAVGLAALLSRLMEQTISFGALNVGLIIAGVVAAWTVVAACNVLPAAAAARMPAADAIRYE